MSLLHFRKNKKSMEKPKESIVNSYFKDIFKSLGREKQHPKHYYAGPPVAPQMNIEPIRISEVTIQQVADSVSQHRQRSKERKHSKAHHRSHHGGIGGVSLQEEYDHQIDDTATDSRSQSRQRSKNHYKNAHRSKGGREDDYIAEDSKIKLTRKKKHGRKSQSPEEEPVVAGEEEEKKFDFLKMMDDAGCTPRKCEHWKRRPYIRIGTCLDPKLRGPARDIGLLSRIFMNKRRLGCLCRPSYLRFGKLCHLQVRRIKSSKRYKNCYIDAIQSPPLHMQYVHNMHWNFLKDSEKRVCPHPTCNAVLVGEKNYNDHINLVHDKSCKYQCFFCHLGFRNEIEKKNHEYEHIKELDLKKNTAYNASSHKHNDLDKFPTKLVKDDAFKAFQEIASSSSVDSQSFIRCQICGQDCADTQDLKDHFVHQHVHQKRRITNKHTITYEDTKAGYVEHNEQRERRNLRGNRIHKHPRVLLDNYYKKINLALEAISDASLQP